MTDDDDDEVFVGMYDFLKAVEDAIKSARPETRAALATAIQGYGDSCPDEFYWAIGAQAPTLLSHLMMAIDMSSDPKHEAESRPPILFAGRALRSKN